MTSKAQWLIALTLSLLLAGCASGPSYDEYAGNIDAVDPAKGRIYVYRTATLGAAIQPAVRLNGSEVGKAKPKGFFYVDVDPGDYTISCSTEAERNLSLNVGAGETRYVRLEVKMGVFAGHIKPVLVDNNAGSSEIKKTKYTGATGS